MKIRVEEEVEEEEEGMIENATEVTYFVCEEEVDWE